MRASNLGKLEYRACISGITVEAFLQFLRQDFHRRLFDDVVMIGGHLVNIDPSDNQIAPTKKLIVAVLRSSRRGTKQSQPRRIDLRLIVGTSAIIHILDCAYSGLLQRTSELPETAREIMRSRFSS